MLDLAECCAVVCRKWLSVGLCGVAFWCLGVSELGCAAGFVAVLVD